MSDFMQFRTGIKSIQRGSLTLDANPDTVTITAVVLAKSFVIISFSLGEAGYSSRDCRVVLTNTTTLTFDQTTTNANLVAWQVIEFY